MRHLAQAGWVLWASCAFVAPVLPSLVAPALTLSAPGAAYLIYRWRQRR